MGRIAGQATVADPAASLMNSRSRSTIWKVLFEMPKAAELGASGDRRCASCDIQMGSTEGGVSTVCVFCEAWAQWRREDDELWARVVRDREDDGSPSTAHAQLLGLAAGR